MKIGILTHYQAESHGALLQLYALTRYLKQRGHEVYTLTYSRNMDFASEADRKKFSVGLSSVPYYLREYLLQKGPGYVWTMLRRHFVLRRFLRKQFRFLPYDSCRADAAIVGSDEVWSLQLGMNTMLFAHGVDARKILSYAPSFGQTELSGIVARGCVEPIREGLEKFDSLSARDPSACELVRTLSGRPAELVCDPVLLYGFREELSACRRMTQEKYVLVYAYAGSMNGPERIKEIRGYARSIDARVYSLGAYHGWCDRQIVCDPLEMLSWFRGAEAVFTDTFHGTLCAFLTHTAMAVYVLATNSVKLAHLLSVLNLQSRQITARRTAADILSEPLDFDTLRQACAPFTDRSAAFLDRALRAGK